MRNILRFGSAIMLGGAVCMTSLAGAEVKATGGAAMTDGFMQSDAEKASVYAVAAGAFRECAVMNPEKAVTSYFTAQAKSKWSLKISSDMIVQQVTDFFTGSILLSGPVGDRESIVGLYNPWWDGMLMLKLRATETGNAKLDVKVSDFIFQSGETFRDEPVSTNAVSCLTVVPEKDPMSVELWRVVSRTRKTFMSLLPMDGKPTWGRVAEKALRSDWKTELTVLQTRSLLRMQHSLGLLKNARDTGIAAFITRLARNGTRLQLYKYFGKKDCHPLLNTFCEVPKVFRKDFLPYCYVPTEQGTLFVLVNKKMPRIYVTVSLAKEIKVPTSGLEWYDLMQADELLDAWNSSRKEDGR